MFQPVRAARDILGRNACRSPGSTGLIDDDHGGPVQFENSGMSGFTRWYEESFQRIMPMTDIESI